jgi:hypothetical protein
MPDRNDLELQLAAALAPMLLTVSIFSLTLVGNIDKPESTYVDEVLCFLSGLCVLGAAMVADSALDKANVSIRDRFTFLGGGYFLFCAAAGAMTIVIPLLYIAKKTTPVPIPPWQYFIYVFTGLSMTAKLMQNKETAWTVGMFVLAVATICAVAST